MSITFWIGKRDETKPYLVPSHECDCIERFGKAWDEIEEKRMAALEAKEEELPPYPDHADFGCKACVDFKMNLANANAFDLLRWLDLPVDDNGGQIKASELAALCRRRLWFEGRNYDQAIEGEWGVGKRGALFIEPYRPNGYLREKTERLLKICEAAQEDEFIVWA